MTPLDPFHQSLNAQFTEVNGQQAVAHYGDPLAEYTALRQSAAWLDLSFRSRICLTGADRLQYLDGQVSNQIKNLKPGQGCYATLLTPKGKMESDLNIYVLENEILLDFEPGLTDPVTRRLQKNIIADDVQLVDVAPLYGLLSLQGPKSAAALQTLHLPVPTAPMSSAKSDTPQWGEAYVNNHSRVATGGFDLFIPAATMLEFAKQLSTTLANLGGRPCGCQALETARIEAAIPRFGADMDTTTLPPEARLQDRAISYKKGCYVGQETIARLRTYGHVAKTLVGIRLTEEISTLPQKGDKILHDQKEIGHITSATFSPVLNAPIALAYVRRETSHPGTPLQIQSTATQIPGVIAPLPFIQL